jgi:hypothetical protein
VPNEYNGQRRESSGNCTKQHSVLSRCADGNLSHTRKNQVIEQKPLRFLCFAPREPFERTGGRIYCAAEVMEAVNGWKRRTKKKRSEAKVLRTLEKLESRELNSDDNSVPWK